MLTSLSIGYHKFIFTNSDEAAQVLALLGRASHVDRKGVCQPDGDYEYVWTDTDHNIEFKLVQTNITVLTAEEYAVVRAESEANELRLRTEREAKKARMLEESIAAARAAKEAADASESEVSGDE